MSSCVELEMNAMMRASKFSICVEHFKKATDITPKEGVTYAQLHTLPTRSIADYVIAYVAQQSLPPFHRELDIHRFSCC